MVARFVIDFNSRLMSETILVEQ